MSVDEDLRAAERRAQADPEALDDLRALQFKLGLDPFPRALWTREWREVFATPPPRGLFMETCRHLSHRRPDATFLHQCSHDDRTRPTVNGIGVTSQPPIWRLESCATVEWQQRTRRVAREGGAALPEVRIGAVIGLRTGCSFRVLALFLLVSERWAVRSVDAIHSPCPAEQVTDSRLEWSGLAGNDRHVNPSGVPYELLPTGMSYMPSTYGPFSSMPASRSSGPGRPTVLDGVLASPLCTCGHSSRRHASSTNGPRVCNESGCGCEAFTRVPLCRCGHVEASHAADSGCFAGSSDNQDDPPCECAAWDPAPSAA